jgi:N-acetylglucosamine-6-phosphate deacetylase
VENGRTISPPQKVSGRLVLEDRILPGRVQIENGWIVGVEPDGAEADGPYISPGFVDVHVHGGGGYGAMDGPEALSGMAQALLRHGVTGFLPTAVTASFDTLSAFAANVRNWMPQAPADGAEPLGFNFEGPYINPEKMGAQNPAFIQVPAEADRRRLEDLLDGLRFITMAPEVPGALDLIRWFAAHGVVISLGHSNTSYAIAAAAYAAGARSTTHIFNAMSGVHQHEPGLAVAALADNGAYVEMIADGHHVDRSVWPLVWRAKRPDRLIFVSDAISMAGAGQGRFSLGGLDVEIVGDECRLVSDGHLAGSVIAIDTAVRNMVQAGLSLSRAVAAATQNPLALLGVTDRGRLAPDQRADLVELDADLRVHRVMRAGRWYEGPAA